MAITFRIKQHPATKNWVPVHAEIENSVGWSKDVSEQEARLNMFEQINILHPDVYTLDYDIEELRGEVLSKVDHRSDEMLEGFLYAGIVFSLSPKAQIRYEYMDRTAATLPYPLPINSLDDRDMLVLENPEQTHAFCTASTTHVLTVVGSGTIEKDKIRAMTTVEELLGYVDPR